MITIRKIVSSKSFIHVIVLLGFLALWGYIEIDNPYFLFLIALSSLGAICGAFIRVIDTIKNK